MRCVLFDFDLTLADSSAGAEASINYALCELGLPCVDTATARSTVGLSLADTCLRLTGRDGPELVRRFTDLFVQRADEVMTQNTRLYPQVPCVIAHLVRAGLRLGIVSTKFRYRIEEILSRERLLDPFGVVIGGEDVKAHKPDPAGLCMAMDRLHVLPEQTVYVGDHLLDAEASLRAGTAFAAVLTGVARREDFAGYHPLAVLNTLADLPAVLEGSR